jgi:hypothetical protein
MVVAERRSPRSQRYLATRNETLAPRDRMTRCGLRGLSGGGTPWRYLNGRWWPRSSRFTRGYPSRVHAWLERFVSANAWTWTPVPAADNGPSESVSPLARQRGAAELPTHPVTTPATTASTTRRRHIHQDYERNRHASPLSRPFRRLRSLPNRSKRDTDAERLRQLRTRLRSAPGAASATIPHTTVAPMMTRVLVIDPIYITEDTVPPGKHPRIGGTPTRRLIADRATRPIG